MLDCVMIYVYMYIYIYTHVLHRTRAPIPGGLDSVEAQGQAELHQETQLLKYIIM